MTNDQFNVSFQNKSFNSAIKLLNNISPASAIETQKSTETLQHTHNPVLDLEY